MANRQVTSSERKGALVVAAIALAVTLCGLGAAWCGRPAKVIAPHDVEVLVSGDTADGKTHRPEVTADSSESGERAVKDGGKGSKGKNGKKSEKKKYPRRSPLDEPV